MFKNCCEEPEPAVLNNKDFDLGPQLAFSCNEDTVTDLIKILLQDI